MKKCRCPESERDNIYIYIYIVAGFKSKKEGWVREPIYHLLCSGFANGWALAEASEHYSQPRV